MYQKFSLPIAVNIQPLNDPETAEGFSPVPIVNFGNCGVIRCKRCRTYMNPFVAWLEKSYPIAILLAVVIFVLWRLPKLDLGYTEAFRRRRVANWLPLGLTYAFLYMGRYNLTVSKGVFEGQGLVAEARFSQPRVHVSAKSVGGGGDGLSFEGRRQRHRVPPV